eukprot:Tamp_38564.p2 GENE.Tamp_38564~~Tamp_38564.p2  ORF type:complete len:105 (+),score=17.59 Tamp_38564:58-372(+)
MPRSPEQDRGKAVRLVRMELQARLRAANGMHVDFLDTFLLCSVGTQRKSLEDKFFAASSELRHLLRTSLGNHACTHTRIRALARGQHTCAGQARMCARVPGSHT